jgi:hypothetical protein
MPVNAIAMPFSFAAIDSPSLIDPPRLETGVMLAILLDASELNQWINWSESQA